MDISLIITLLVMLFLIIGFLSGKFKLGLVAMTATTILYLTGVLEFSEAYAYFSDKNVIMVGAIFILSGALSKTSLVPFLKNLIMKHSDKGGLIIFLYLLANAVLIQFSMPTALVAMMLPFMAAFSSESKIQPSHVLLPGVVVAHCWQGMFPGVFFAMLNSFLEAAGSEYQLGMLDYTKVVAIPAIFALLYMALVGWRGFPAAGLANASADMKQEKAESQLTPGKEKLVYIVFIITFAGILFSNYLPIDMQVLPVIADLVLLFCGVLDINDVKNFMNLDALFMLVGVLPLATAMQKTGAGTVVANGILKLLGGNPAPIAILAAFYFAGALLTQFMNNTATQNVFVALAVVTAVELGLDPRAFCVAIFAGCTAAMLTPTGSPSVAIAFGAGGYKIKDVLKVNLPLWIIYGVLVIFMANLVFPLT
ncbi:MAG: anion permease [Lachnospiraceae bacterium]|nr:anion permease [Lachnospiraceae bacterium]